MFRPWLSIRYVSLAATVGVSEEEAMAEIEAAWLRLGRVSEGVGK